MEPDKKKGFSFNVSTAKREELVTAVLALSERTKAMKAQVAELEAEVRSKTDEAEYAELRANELERKVEAIRKVHEEQSALVAEKLQAASELLQGSEHADAVNALFDDISRALDDVPEEQEDELVKEMRTTESRRMLEVNDQKWRTELEGVRETMRAEQERAAEAARGELEELRHRSDAALQDAARENTRLAAELKATTQAFSEYKARITATFELSKDLRQEHEHCDTTVFELKAEIERLKFENERLAAKSASP